MVGQKSQPCWPAIKSVFAANNFYALVRLAERVVASDFSANYIKAEKQPFGCFYNIKKTRFLSNGLLSYYFKFQFNDFVFAKINLCFVSTCFFYFF